MTTPALDRTYALVVGIERYDAGPSWELPGPARDAVRFRDWLRRAGVPERNILLHLSPAPGYDPAVPYRPAGHHELRKAVVSDLPAMGAELLWVWWGGHGVLDQDEHIRLFCADATTTDKRNVDLESTRRSLGSDVLPGSTRQIWIVDACQTFEEEFGFRRGLPTETFPAGRRTNVHEQVLMLAATRGQRAANDPQRRTGLFSDSVLDVLEGTLGSAWPPDPGRLSREVRARLDQLRAQGHTGQVPSVSFHSPQHSEIPGQRPAPDRREAPAGPVAELIRALLDYPMMADPDERQVLVAELRTKSVERMPRHRVPRTDLVGIVRVLRRNPGELWLLYDAVTLLDDDDARAVVLESAVRQCAGPRAPGT